jgi:hypothetical protein
MDKHEWPAMYEYAKRNNVPDDALGDNPVEFLRGLSISDGPPFHLREQGEYIRFLEMKLAVLLPIAVASCDADKRIQKLRAALACAETYDIDGMRLVARNALAEDTDPDAVESAVTVNGVDAALLKENAAFRTHISMLELALDEIYCSVRRAKSAKECPTDCKAVLHDELYSQNIELLNIAVRNHNEAVSALEEVQRQKDRNESLTFECKKECARLDAIIAEGNIKPLVTGVVRVTGEGRKKQE